MFIIIVKQNNNLSSDPLLSEVYKIKNKVGIVINDFDEFVDFLAYLLWSNAFKILLDEDLQEYLNGYHHYFNNDYTIYAVYDYAGNYKENLKKLCNIFRQGNVIIKYLS